jgi:type II secretory pathway component PulF
MCRSLGLMLDIGFPLLHAIPLAAAAGSNPLMLDGVKSTVEALESGKPLAAALKSLGYLPAGFLPLLKGGEESGKTGEVLLWLADLYERNFEAAIDAALALVEPVVICILGTLVGFMVIATMLPMVTMISNL